MKDSIKHHPAKIARNKDIEIMYDAFGNPEARPLLLVMGLADQMITWPEDFCKNIAGKGFFVIRFDNRDIGLSTILDHEKVPNIPLALLKRFLGLPVNVPYDLTDMAGDAVAVLDALGIEKAHVMGASMGGMVGQQMALDHPDRVLSLVSLISGPDIIPNFSIVKNFAMDMVNRILGKETNGRPISPSLMALQFLMKPIPTDREGFAAFYTLLNKVVNGGGIPLNPEESREHALELFERGLSPKGTLRQFAGIIGSPPRNHRLGDIQAPTLVVHGGSDPLIPIQVGLESARLMKGAQLKVVEKMGHWLPRPVWGELSRTLEEFWDGL